MSFIRKPPRFLRHRPLVIDPKWRWFWTHIRAAYVPVETNGDGTVLHDIVGSADGALDNSSADITLSNRAYGRVLTFSGDATNDRVNLGSIASGHPLYFGGEDKLSCLARVRFANTGGGGGFPRIFDKSTTGSAANGYALWFDLPNLFIFAASGGYEMRYTYSLSTNEELDIGFTTVGSSLNSGQFYHDGAPVSTTLQSTTPSSFPSVTANMAIGNWNHTTNRMWDGDIGFLYIFGGEAPARLFRELYKDPFGPFRRYQPSPVFIPAAAGGGVGAGILEGLKLERPRLVA